VHRITDFGVFVSIDDTSLVGLSRKHLAASERTADLNDVFDVGDHVKAMVMGISGHKIALGLKPSLFEGNESSSDDEDGSDDEDEEEEEEADEEEDIVLVDSDEESEDERDIQAMIREASMGDGEDSDEEADENDEDDDEDEDDDDEEEEESGSEEDDEDDIGTEVPKSKKHRMGEVPSAAPKPVSNGLSKTTKTSASASTSIFSQAPAAPLVSATGSMFLDWGNSFAPASSSKAQDASDDDDMEEEAGANDSDESEEETSKGKSRKRHADALREEAEIRKKEVDDAAII
jgi:predicted RNA-binding protein with RPS1 domain